MGKELCSPLVLAIEKRAFGTPSTMVANNNNIYIYYTREIPCTHHPPTRSDNTVSVAPGGIATPGATKQHFATGQGI